MYQKIFLASAVALLTLWDAQTSALQTTDVKQKANKAPPELEAAFKEKAELLFSAYISGCVQTQLDQQKISGFADENGWIMVRGQEGADDGVFLWRRLSPLLQLEIRDDAEGAPDLKICSVSLLENTPDIEQAKKETDYIRALLAPDWVLGPIEEVPPVEVFGWLPEKLKDELGVPTQFQQYKFFFTPRKNADASSTEKFGYLWATGEHRLMYSQEK